MLLILTPAWLWTWDDWILRWNKLFYFNVAEKIRDKINEEGKLVLKDKKGILKRLHIDGDKNCLTTKKTLKIKKA